MNDHRSTSNDGISVRAAFDRQLVFDRGRSVRYLVVDLTAPPAFEGMRKVKPALNLALVIDASGSMAGAPLAAAKKAAAGIAESLSDNDYLSIVSFATDVITHLSSTPMNGLGRKQAVAAIRGMESRDSTNLSLGWLTGSECVAAIEQELAGSHNHVIVLSDGHANAGITDPMVLQHHADQLRMRGVLTSCVGIGNGYSPTQLQALADYGGGRLHDAEYPQEIIEVVFGEFQELQQTVVRDIAVRLSYPSSVVAENLSGFPAVVSSVSTLAQVGMLGAEGERAVIYRVMVPQGKANDVLSFNIDCSWVRTGGEEQVEGPTQSANLRFTQEAFNTFQQRDIPLSLRVATTWQAAVVREAVKLNRSGDLGALRKYLDHELKFFSEYCKGLPKGEKLVDELRAIRQAADRTWDERVRKNLHYSNYLTQQNRTDHRANQKGTWFSQFES